MTHGLLVSVAVENHPLSGRFRVSAIALALSILESAAVDEVIE
jgi:hypothetical protein